MKYVQCFNLLKLWDNNVEQTLYVVVLHGALGLDAKANAKLLICWIGGGLNDT